jgi:hypothetical protein
MVDQMSSAEQGAVKEYHGLAISSDELRSKLSSRDEPIMIFDIGDENRHKRDIFLARDSWFAMTKQ